MADFKFSPGRLELRTTLREDVTETLRQAIVDGSLPSEAELNQVQLAEKLGTSRGPVREALTQLEQEGLVYSIPYKGVYVTPLTPRYIQELYSLRSALETFALRQGMARLDTAAIAHLRDIIAQMRAAIQEGDNERLAALDLEFHHSIIELADHDMLRHTWKPLSSAMMRCLHTRHRMYPSLDAVIGSHPDLVDAIAARDTDRACAILEEHIIEAGDKLCRYWAEQPNSTIEELEIIR